MTYGEHAPLYIAARIPVIPVDAEKRPLVKAWSKCCTALPPPADIAGWVKTFPRAGIGIPAGPASGIVAVDIDVDDPAVLAMLPASPSGKRGMRGETWFYRYSAHRSSGYIFLDGKHIGEFISTGKQTVIPPSWHQKAGRAYQWLGKPLLDALPDLSELPEAFFDRFMPARKPKDFTPEPRTHTDSEDLDLNAVAEALDWISADDREVWIQIGMALKDRFGNASLSVWDAWSRTSIKYVPGEPPRVWAGFNGSGITLGTLIFHARRGGWKPRAGEVFLVRPASAVAIEPGGNLSPSTSSAADIYQPPGLVGRIHRWMLDTAMHPHPELALPAAIACTGAIMAHRVQFFTGLRTNIYTLALADSGEGKGHPKHCILSLLKDTGYKESIIGQPKSDAGLLSALAKARGAGIVVYDEYGRVLDAMVGRNTPSHLKSLMTLKVDLYTESEGELIGAQYANHDGKHARVDIDQPCLSIAAMTVPERFFASLTDTDALDGFLARWLVFSVENSQSRHPRIVRDKLPPVELVREVMGWLSRKKDASPEGNMPRINPAVLPCAAGVEDMFWGYYQDCYRHKQSAPDKGAKSIWSRLAATAGKLSLLATEGDTVTAEAMRWGIAVADQRGKWLMQAITRYVSSNETEAEVKRLLRILQDAEKPLTKSEIIRKTQWLKTQRRDEILRTLEDGGSVDVTEDKSKNNKIKFTYGLRRDSIKSQ